MNIAVVGGGSRCTQFLNLIGQHKFQSFDPEPRVVAVADPEPTAPGRKMAEQMGLFSTGDYNDLLTRTDIDLIIELTGSMEIYNDILRKKPFGMRAISARTARLFWEVANLANKAEQTDHKLEKAQALAYAYINGFFPEEVVVIRSDFRILDANETIARRLGLHRDELIGQFCYKAAHRLDHPCKGDKHPCPLAETLATGKPSQVTHVHLDKNDREAFFSISCYPIIENGQVTGAVEISRDITRDINLQKTMMRQEKLASVGRLSAGVAHEINNPLTTILTSAMLIQEDLPVDHPAYPELTTIANEALRCRKIVASLLDFARQNRPEKKNRQINDVVMSSILLTKKQAAFKDVTLKLEFAKEIPEISIDKQQIQQAVINLVLNAVEASPVGAEVTIRTALIDSGCAAEVTVIDRGEGISEVELNRIFDPFFTTKAQGNGLGLAITLGIIEQHGGVLLVNSRKGEGSTFTFKLPYAAGKT